MARWRDGEMARWLGREMARSLDGKTACHSHGGGNPDQSIVPRAKYNILSINILLCHYTVVCQGWIPVSTGMTKGFNFYPQRHSNAISCYALAG